MKLLPLVFFLLPQVAGSAATEPVDCLPAAPLPLNVRIGTALVPQTRAADWRQRAGAARRRRPTPA